MMGKVSKPVGKVEQACLKTGDKMESIPYIKCRVGFVAYFQIASASLVLLLAFCFLFRAVNLTALNLDDQKTLLEARQGKYGPIVHFSAFVPLTWTILAIVLADTVLQLWASFRLLRSTEIGTTLTHALECIRLWQNVNVVTTIMLSCVLLATPLWILGLLFLAVRLTFMCEVSCFKTILTKKFVTATVAQKRKCCACCETIQIVIPPNSK